MSKSLKKLSRFKLDKNELKNLKGGRKRTIKNPIGGGGVGLPPLVPDSVIIVPVEVLS